MQIERKLHRNTFVYGGNYSNFDAKVNCFKLSAFGLEKIYKIKFHRGIHIMYFWNQLSWFMLGTNRLLGDTKYIF